MKKPFEILQLEDIYGIHLKPQENASGPWCGKNFYATDKNNRIIRLNLSDNNIRYIQGLEPLVSLQDLDLSGNQIESVENLEQLSQLRFLNLSINRIRQIQNISTLTQLLQLNLSGNQIKKIQRLEQLTRLSGLDLSYNQIDQIENLDTLQQVQQLDLSRNRIRQIAQLAKLSRLEKLNLSGNQISRMQNLEKLTLLQHLDLSSNQLIKIEKLEKLSQLMTLSLADNHIRKIENLDKQGKLHHLDLADNAIGSIGKLEHQSHLEYLNLTNNNIYKNPDFQTINNIKTLKYLEISGNPFLRHIPSLLLPENTNHLHDILNFLSAQNTSRIEVCLPVKIMLLGNHASGKSSFLHFLIHDRLPCKIKSTHILNIRPYPARFGNLPEAIVYDLGGQDYYHGLYQAFFSLGAIHLLLWCNPSNANQIRPRSTPPTRDFAKEYWMYQLHYLLERKKTANETSDDPLLVIQTHADQKGDQRHNSRANASTFHIVNEFYLSLDKKEVDRTPHYQLGLAYLAATLQDEIRKKKVIEKRPVYYKEFLQFILSSKRRNCIPLREIPYNRQKQEGETDAHIYNYLKADLKQLAWRGMILYCPENKELEDVAWLNPTLSIRHIYQSVLSEKMIRLHKGVLPAAVFDNICPDPKTKLLMLNEKIIFHNRAADEYIIPSYLPLSCDESLDFGMMVFDFSKPCFVLKFNCFIPFGLINQLICLYGDNPDKKIYWRDQLLFTYQEAYKVWIKLDFSHLEIAVFITTKNNHPTFGNSICTVEKKIFHDILDLYQGNDPRQNRSTQHMPFENQSSVPIPEDLYISVDNLYFVSYKTLRQTDNIQHTVVTHPLFPHTRVINSSCSKIQSIFLYNSFTNNTHNKMKKIFISYSRKDVGFKNELKKHLGMLRLFDIADSWSCEDITIGRWDEQIQRELEESELIIYMLSANFFSSQYILEKEVLKGMEEITFNKNKKVLCVIVSDFVSLDKLKRPPLHLPGNTLQHAILQLSDYQYLPYAQTINPETGNIEEKIIPLKSHPSIEKALAEITEKVLNLFSQEPTNG